MDEQYQAEQERENLSGADLAEAYYYEQSLINEKTTVPQVIAATDCTTELCLKQH
jgi:hypothetical protein